ncbi:DUF3331 domain-containing protein [Paraburkholderia dipogonis]|uniref:DUF3331 domain-containing protein n=1 Tax=Paraburkholderia dipogonis TaxID=1211383 RepID=UPI001FCA4C79|nr:DUF3331 domain-containing protein [Paraburkholderia dipogonis]
MRIVHERIGYLCPGCTCRRCIARKAGVCALSGQKVARGDAVYRPRHARPAPRNVKAMILATVTQATPVEEAG